MNIYDIAKISGVSIATVSRVINGSQGVTENTRLKVLDAIKSTGYRPSHIAKSLSKSKSHVVGVMMPGVNHYFSQRIDGILKVLRDKGYSLMITTNDPKRHSTLEDMANFNLLFEKRVDGIIFFPTFVEDKHVKKINELSQKMSIVITDMEIEGVDLNYVLQDSTEPTKEVMAYLISLGHQHIGFINGLDYDVEHNERLKIYWSMLKEAGIEPSLDDILQGGYSIESGYEKMKAYLQAHDRTKLPTAFVSANDNMAIGAMRAIQEVGLQIPKDMAVIGYDDIDFSKYTTPPLSTVRIDQFKMGEQAAQILIEDIEYGERPYEKWIANYELIVREST